MAGLSCDPFDWTIDEVVDALCKNKDLWTDGNRDPQLPDAAKFEGILRANKINGRTLLRSVDYYTLKEDLKIRALGEIDAIIDTVDHLRGTSTKFRGLKRSSDLTSTESSLIATGLRASPVVIREPSPNRYTFLTPANSSLDNSIDRFQVPRDSTPSFTSEPRPRTGETLIESNGRKRRRLTVPVAALGQSNRVSVQTSKDAERSPPEWAHTVPVQHNAVLEEGDSAENPMGSTMPDHPTSVTVAAHGLERNAFSEDGNELQATYLGTKALGVETVFFSNTAIGDNIQHEATLGTLASLSTAEESIGNFIVLPENEPFPGQRSYIFNMMKYFFHQCDQAQAKYGGPGAVVVSPYRRSIQRLHQLPGVSVMLFEAEDDDIKATRGIRLDNGMIAKNADTLTIDSQLGRDLGHEWDHLLDRYGQQDTDILPLLGDSGDENEYDSELCEEIEQEAQEEAAKRRFLSLEDVNAVIKDYISDVAREQQHDLHAREATEAWRIWRSGSSRRTRQRLAQYEAKNVLKLDKRLDKLVKELVMDHEWTRSSLRRQCQCLDQTVETREEHRWKSAILELEKEPLRPAVGSRKSLRRPKTRVSRSSRDDSAAEDVGNNSGLSASDTEDIYAFADFDGIDHMDLSGMETDDAAKAARVVTGHDYRSEEDSCRDLDIDQKSSKSDIVDHNANCISQRDKDQSTSPSCSTRELKPSIAAPTPPEAASVIDLTFSSDGLTDNDSPNKQATQQLVIYNGTSVNESQIYVVDPLGAPDLWVARWEWKQLEETQDRKRLIIKLVRTTELKLYISMRDWILSHPLPKMIDDIKRGLGALFQGNQFISGLNEGEVLVVFKLSRFYVCWYYVDHEYAEGFLPAHMVQQPLQEANHGDDVDQFCIFLKTFIKLYEIPINERATSEALGLPDERGSGSDKDDESVPDGSQAKRVKRGKQSQQTLALQQSAKRRQEKAAYASAKLQSQYGQMNESSFVEEDVEQGNRVPVNIEASPDSYIYINPYISKSIKAHQIDGVRFMWREVITAATDEDNKLQGCLLAHTMGLGKTLQAITLLVAIAESARSPKPEIYNQIPEPLREFRALILCPAGLVPNWDNELQLWIPKPTRKKVGKSFVIEAHLPLEPRISRIKAWYEEGGILVMGYEMFRVLVTDRQRPEHEQDLLRDWLLDGPTIIVADEAHNLRNRKSGISKAVAQLRSTSRIALTGSPLANNLEEYYALINWVAPNYLGDYDSFSAHYKLPIEDGSYGDSTRSQKRLATRRLHALRQTIAPKVERADITVLKNDLPPKVEFLITVPLTAFQKRGYVDLIKSITTNNDVEKTSTTRIFAWLNMLSLLCNHPFALGLKLEQKQKQTATQPNQAKDLDGLDSPGDDAGDDIDKPAADLLGNDAVSEQVQLLAQNGDPLATDLSYKSDIILQIIKHATQRNEHVLIFSQSLHTLNFFGKLLDRLMLRYTRLDGSVAMRKRAEDMKQFNQGEYDVFLVSTRAGGLGLNLQRATRVIIVDFKYNPQHEQQAIGRAFRIGQIRPVYVYRFIAGGTFETDLMNKNIFKTQLADRVVDERKAVRVATKTREYLQEPKDVPQEDLTPYMGKDPHVLDKILEAAKKGRDVHIRAITTTETFLTEEYDDLTEEELKQAMDELDDYQLRINNPREWEKRKYIEQERLVAESIRKVAAVGIQHGTSPGVTTAKGQLLAQRRGEPLASNEQLVAAPLPTYDGNNIPGSFPTTQQEHHLDTGHRPKTHIPHHSDAHVGAVARSAVKSMEQLQVSAVLAQHEGIASESVGDSLVASKGGSSSTGEVLTTTPSSNHPHLEATKVPSTLDPVRSNEAAHPVPPAHPISPNARSVNEMVRDEQRRTRLPECGRSASAARRSKV